MSGAETQGAVKAVIAAIDAANSADPTSEDGAPAALLYGQRMTDVLTTFQPGASPHLHIAVRGSHVERFTRPRKDWPEGRAGYLRWREELKRFHADRVAGFMADAGWPQPDRDRVAAIIRKEGIKRNPESQTLEDVACLVLMRWGLAGFAAKHPHEKVLDILAKTGRKMSSEGRKAAAELQLSRDYLVALDGKVE